MPCARSWLNRIVGHGEVADMKNLYQHGRSGSPTTLLTAHHDARPSYRASWSKSAASWACVACDAEDRRLGRGWPWKGDHVLPKNAADVIAQGWHRRSSTPATGIVISTGSAVAGVATQAMRAAGSAQGVTCRLTASGATRRPGSGDSRRAAGTPPERQNTLTKH